MGQQCRDERDKVHWIDRGYYGLRHHYSDADRRIGNGYVGEGACVLFHRLRLICVTCSSRLCRLDWIDHDFFHSAWYVAECSDRDGSAN